MPDMYVRMVARQVAALALHPEFPAEIAWEEYPEIGEHDWEAVIAEVAYIADVLRVSQDNYDHAYAQLAARVGDV